MSSNLEKELVELQKLVRPYLPIQFSLRLGRLGNKPVLTLYDHKWGIVRNVLLEGKTEEELAVSLRNWKFLLEMFLIKDNQVGRVIVRKQGETNGKVAGELKNK